MKKIFAALGLLAVVGLAGGVQAGGVPGYGVTIGGNVNIDLGWQILGQESIFANESGGAAGNFFTTINSDSNLHTTFTSADKDSGAYIEFGVYSATNSDNFGSGEIGVDFRYGYGWWNVGSCKLLVGQMDGRLGDGGTLQMLGDMKSGKGGSAGFGFIGATRNPKAALQMDVNGNVSFEVALGQAGAETATLMPDVAFGDTVSSSNSYLPRLEAVVDFSFENFSFGLGAGVSYQEAKVNDAISAGYEDKVLSYLLWIPVEYTSGPFSALLNAHFGQNIDTDWTGENTSDFDAWGNGNGIYGAQPGALPVARDTGNGYEIENTRSWGVGLDLNYALNDSVTLALGGGFTHLSNDAWGNNGEDSYTRWSVYAAAPIALTDNLTIQPEVGYYNYGEWYGAWANGGGEDAGDEWLMGVNFQFSF